MTLNDLADKYLDLIARLMRDGLTAKQRANWLVHVDALAKNYDKTLSAKHNYDETFHVWQAAKLYVVAREQGLCEATLWQLQNGGAV